MFDSPATTLRDYQQDLTRALGPVLSGRALARALGYPSPEAFRKAYERGRIPIRVFEIEGRRGRFGATADIAAWLWAQRFPEQAASNPPE